LSERGVSTRLATRTPKASGQVRFDWADRGTHGEALRGTSAVYLIAPMDVPDPVRLVVPFLDEALRQGVRRVVQLSSSAIAEGTPGLGEVHHLVRTTVPEWTVLRPSWFMQNFIGDHLVAQGVRSGEIVTATGEGRVAFVDAADIAAVAGHALTDDQSHNTEHVLTGPEALTYADAAGIITDATGRTVGHRSVSADESARRIAAHGIPAEFVRHSPQWMSRSAAAPRTASPTPSTGSPAVPPAHSAPSSRGRSGEATSDGDNQTPAAPDGARAGSGNHQLAWQPWRFRRTLRFRLHQEATGQVTWGLYGLAIASAFAAILVLFIRKAGSTDDSTTAANGETAEAPSTK
jgi:uncharacterized protein YbjT (DUF2867 family)